MRQTAEAGERGAAEDSCCESAWGQVVIASLSGSWVLRVVIFILSIKTYRGIRQEGKTKLIDTYACNGRSRSPNILPTAQSQCSSLPPFYDK